MEDFDMVQKMLVLCETETGTQINELRQHGKMFNRIQVLEDGRVPAQKARDWNICGQKKRITRILKMFNSTAQHSNHQQLCPRAKFYTQSRTTHARAGALVFFLLILP